MTGAMERLELSVVKAHTSHSKKGKEFLVREHRDSRMKKLEQAASGVQAAKGTYSNPARSTAIPGYAGSAVRRAGFPGASAAEAAAARAHMSRHEPMSDEQYAKHTSMIEKTIDQAMKRGHTTDSQFGFGDTPEERRENAAKGNWQPERARIHREIVDKLLKDNDHVPREGKAIIAGGLGGAGKSTMLKGMKERGGEDPKNYMTLNPDDIKEELARRGLVPEAGNLSPMERASLVHEESSHIANLAAQHAMAEKRNVIWDITMASKGSTQRRVDELRNHGYGKIKGAFVDVPVETSVARALGRHRRGMEAHRQGVGLGGRYVPPEVIRKNKSGTSSSANRDTFEAMKSQFDSWELHDSSGEGGPKLVSKGSGGTKKKVA